MNYKLMISLAVTIVLSVGCADPGKNTDINQKQMSDIERGRYVVKLLGCNDCHTPDYMMTRANIPETDWLVGGDLGFHSPSGTVYPTNLRLLLDSISEEDWLTLARQMREDSPMSWVMLPKTSEQDLRAVYRFIKYLGPKGEPTLARLPAGVTPTTPYLEYTNPH